MFLSLQRYYYDDMEKESPNMLNEPMMTPSLQADSSFDSPNNNLFSMLSSISIDDIPVAVKYLADKLATAKKKKTVAQSTHIWDNYKLSAEIISMAPAERKDIYGNYKSDLADILEEKYK